MSTREQARRVWAALQYAASRRSRTWQLVPRLPMAWHLVTWGLTIMSLAGCLPVGAPHASEHDVAASQSWTAEFQERPIRVRLFYGTDRRAEPAIRPGLEYGRARAGALQVGMTTVNVPSYARRKDGEIPKPPYWRVNRWVYAPDSVQDMFVRTVRPMSEAAFLDSLRRAIANDRAGSAFVFVHGYANTFEDAALRAAQLAVDLRFDGAPIVYSWPSAGTPTGYAADKESARNSGFYFAQFLKMVVARTGARRVHLIVHSMGSEVVAAAIQSIGDSLGVVQLDQIVLAAPDIDRQLFEREILPRLANRSQRVTMYASREDRALSLSREYNRDWRLGLGGDSLVVLPGMDTIDATELRIDFLGHTPFPASVFLNDLNNVLAHGTPPDDPARRLLRDGQPNAPWWRFRPLH